MRTFSEELLESLSDDELVQGQGELARLVHARGVAAASRAPTQHDLEAVYAARGLDHANQHGKRPINSAKVMASMGRDINGAPLPEKAGKPK